MDLLSMLMALLRGFLIGAGLAIIFVGILIIVIGSRDR